MRRLLVLATAILAPAGCSGATPLSVQNDSGVMLESVVVSGSGFRQALGDIPPGATVRTAIDVSGESGLAMSFVAAGKAVSLPSSGYFEGGGHYVVTVIATPGPGAVADLHMRP